MEPVQNMEEQLWLYIDGLLPPDDKSVIEERLKADADWRSRYEELLGVHRLLSDSELEAPSMRFTKNVMEEISRLTVSQAGKKYLNGKIIWGIGIFFVAMMAGTLIYGLGTMDWSTKNDTAFSKTIQHVNISQYFTSGWMMALLSVNIILGLFLLDNYLGKKRKQYRKEA